MTSATTLTHTPRVVLMCSVLPSTAPTVGNSRCRLATSVEYTPPTFRRRCSMLRRLTFFALLTFAVVTTASAQSPPSMPGMPSMPAGMVMLTPDEMKWGDGPAALPPGLKMVLLEGNPGQPGPFTLRYKFPPPKKLHPRVAHRSRD